MLSQWIVNEISRLPSRYKQEWVRSMQTSKQEIQIYARNASGALVVPS